MYYDANCVHSAAASTARMSKSGMKTKPQDAPVVTSLVCAPEYFIVLSTGKKKKNNLCRRI